MRRSVTITIAGKRSEVPGQRDNGKQFVLTEMPADQAERWCTQAMLLVWEARGQPVPAEMEEAGAAGLAKTGVNLADIRERKALQDPSLDDLWKCIQYKPSAPGVPLQPIIDGENSQIEEIATRTRLRMEVLRLHLGFSPIDESPDSVTPQKSTA